MIDTDIKKFMLRALLARNGQPLSAKTLKLATRGAFEVALTEGELDRYIRQLEADGWIAGTRDDFDGTVWTLTTKGTIRAEQMSAT